MHLVMLSKSHSTLPSLQDISNNEDAQRSLSEDLYWLIDAEASLYGPRGVRGMHQLGLKHSTECHCNADQQQAFHEVA